MPKAGKRRVVGRKVAGRQKSPGMQTRCELLDRRARDVRERNLGDGSRVVEHVRAASIDLDAVRGCIGDRCRHGVLVGIEGDHRPEAELGGDDRQDSQPQPKSTTLAARARASARRKAAWSDAHRSRKRGPGRSRPRLRRRAGRATAGRSRAAPRAPAGETPSSGRASRPRCPALALLRRRARGVLRRPRRYRPRLDPVGAVHFFEALGEDSSIWARASSTRSTGTATETRRIAFSGMRSSACRRTPRRPRTSHPSRGSRTHRGAGAAPPSAAGGRRRERTHVDCRARIPGEPGARRPRRTRTSPGCVPGSKVNSESPSSVGTATVAPRAAG